MNVDGYEIVGELARGGMGVVFRARAPRTGHEVALKLLSAGNATDTQRERFRREGEITARLRHPGIVRVHAAGVDSGRPYLVYELVEGATTLKEALRTSSVPERLALLEQAARALGYAHEQGVVHRDVKPENLLLARDGAVKVADFGLASAPDFERLTLSGQIAGTAHYMAPEQLTAQRDAIGPGSDVWALGVILYEALTGVLPFEANSLLALGAKVADGLRELPSRRSADASPAHDAVCCMALAVAPARRYPDASAFADDLARVREGLPPRARLRRRRRLLPGLVLGPALVGAALLGAWALSAPPAAPVVDEKLAGPERSAVPPLPPDAPASEPPPAPEPPELTGPKRAGILAHVNLDEPGQDGGLCFIGARRLLTWGPNDPLTLWDLGSRVEFAERVQEWPNLVPVQAVIPDPALATGYLVASGDSVFQIRPGTPGASFVCRPRPSVRLRDLSASPDGRSLAVVCPPTKVSVVRRRDGAVVHAWGPLKSYVHGLEFVDDKRLAWVQGASLSSRQPNVLVLFDGARPGGALQRLELPDFGRGLAPLPEHDLVILAAGNEVFQVRLGPELERVEGLTGGNFDEASFTGSVSGLWRSADGRRLVGGCASSLLRGTELRCWDPVTGSQVGSPMSVPCFSTGLALSTDEQLVGVVGPDGVDLYNAEALLGR